MSGETTHQANNEQQYLQIRGCWIGGSLTKEEVLFSSFNYRYFSRKLLQAM